MSALTNITVNKPKTGAEIRQAFVDYFKNLGPQHAHTHMGSASLIPSNPTVLITPAGMLPFVPVFLGIEPPPNPPRAVTFQKCARVSGKASDLNNVGRTPRHHTFFEMLGNFSFGDYFKAEIIPWAWRFVTEVLELPKNRLWVTVYHSDEESVNIWHTQAGVPLERIKRRGEKDNFWGPPGPTGPCGPCSEIFYDMAPNPNQADDTLTGDDLDQDRFVEIWNLVFMELFQDAAGQRTPLEKKNIDTGMGLERVAMILQNKPHTFETDLLFPLVQQAEALSGKAYGKDAPTDVALKIVADHARFVAFALADGIRFSNEGRGYVLRMILRRAVRYGKTALGLNRPFLYQLIPTVVAHYQHAYPELAEHAATMAEATQQEETRFLETLERGLCQLEILITETQTQQQTCLSGDAVFKLYDTFGFPLELTQDIAEEAGLSVDLEGFETAMAQQKQQAKQARKTTALVDDQVYASIMSELGATIFEGDTQLSLPVTVKALLIDGKRVDHVQGTNQPFQVIFDRTPFYPEGGGQVGDCGTLSADNGQKSLTVVINDTQKLGELIVHHALFDQGTALHVGDCVTALVDPVSRAQSSAHHSATHLLHAALRQVLGTAVTQAGSRVAADGARFDFTWPRSVSSIELQRIEFLVNKWIFEGAPRHIHLMPLAEAKASGAVAMFGEKYGETVRVVSFSQHSKELCGGTHVAQSSDIGLMKILSEGAVASGVRRIEFVVGEAAYKQFVQADSELKRAAHSLKASTAEVSAKIETLQHELKQREKHCEQLSKQLLEADITALKTQLEQAEARHTQGDVSYRWLCALLPNKTPNDLRHIAEQLTQTTAQQEPVILCLGTPSERAFATVIGVSKAFAQQHKAYQAGTLFKNLLAKHGGKGGGSPVLAQGQLEHWPETLFGP